ncbi:metal-dependent hydrolase [Brevibacillus sp. AY1]|uniref:metal-dependent hydrolase n=1 Tax=Brevibacillus sp. AY1 TaxID=2807621 RepID=UPI002458042E|nr:metal-dependent hydrolase [Brevibacillus sp. AY1]MDH4619347.1 metal-dependent hydrolase [Brevibacillus sp. AY1]
MDSVTHTLFGLTLYGAVDKSTMTKKEKRALLATAIAGSQIPDIDVISSWWDTTGRYQMWHRGITHSLFMVPVWGALIAVSARVLFRVRGGFWFLFAMLAVWIHNTSDIFNAWGTGYFEPFSSARLTFGAIPIVDVVFWLLMATGLLITRLGRGRFPSHRVFRIVWALMAVHVMAQSVQGAVLVNSVKADFEQTTLTADFIPGVFTVVGKRDEEVQLLRGSVWSELKPVAILESREDTDLQPLFAQNPKAKTLYEWSPFVVIVNDEERVGLYDPRFYRNGASFLFEYMEKPMMR